MATAQERYITDPAQLQDLYSDAIPSGQTAADDTVYSEKMAQHAMPRLRLALLHPLANPAMLAACRTPSNAARKFDSHEYLDISALDKAWRHAMVKAPPASHITFDLSLPKSVDDGDDGDAPPRVYWDTALPRDGHHFGVSARNVMRLAVCIATLTRVRAEGDVLFALSYDEKDKTTHRVLDTLTRQLGNIEKAQCGILRSGSSGEHQADAEGIAGAGEG